MSQFSEKDLDDLINKSFQFGEDDRSLLLKGWEHAQKFIRPRSDYVDDKDELVREGLSTEITFNCVLKTKFDEEPLMKVDMPRKWEIVTDIGPEKTVYSKDVKIDRYTGFQGVILAEQICKVKKVLEDEGHDLKLITPVEVRPLMQNYQMIDCFRPPQVESHIDDDMIAMYKRVYGEFLDSVITNEDKILYIEGDFGAAGMRRLKHVADSLYFDRTQCEAAKRNRSLNNTAGEDFFFLFEGEEWKEFVKGYTIVIHNHLFGVVYNKLKDIQVECPGMNLVAMGTNPDRKDTEIYRLQSEKEAVEAYVVDQTYAAKYGMQIMYEHELYYIVYIDHGRYKDIKPHNYDLMIPFVQLDSWQTRRCFQAFNHMALFLSGPLKILWEMAYTFDEGKISYQKVKNEEMNVNGDLILLPGIPNGNIMLLDGAPVDYNDNERPYWLRRHQLVRAGVVFVPSQNPFYIIDTYANFDCMVTLEEYDVLQEIKAKPIKPYIEVKNIGWNPYLKCLVYDSYCSSIVTAFDSSHAYEACIRISVDFDEKQDIMQLKYDIVGDFSLFTSISYSQQRVEVDPGGLPEKSFFDDSGDDDLLEIWKDEIEDI
jgi:hypothetical protein